MPNIRHYLNILGRVYSGDPLECGGTSIPGGATPLVRKLASSGVLTGKILDYGAGKYARNSNYLRELGHKVYAYDPFNGTPNGDGWNTTTTKLPHNKFDVAFTSYVLNVVPEHVEDVIIDSVNNYATKAVHITRNMDIFNTVKKALLRNDRMVVNFFKKEFATLEELKMLDQGKLSDDTILEFCHHGVQTSRGFQRIPVLESKGFSLDQKTASFKLYT